MQPARQAMPTFPAAALMAAVILAGCGAASPSGELVAASARPTTTAGVTESALQRLKAPPGFRPATCKFLKKVPYTRCYGRNTFVSLNPARFAALITASGLAPVSSTVACPRYLRARPGAPITWDHCLARADTTSVEFAAFATSTKLRRPDAIKPSDRKIAEQLRGTIFELTVATTRGPRP
jgi:hypothetical protein